MRAFGSTFEGVARGPFEKPETSVRPGLHKDPNSPSTSSCPCARPLRVPRWLSDLAAGFAEALWPTRCVGCDRPGTLLCPDCVAALPAIEQRFACPRCGAPFGRLVCTECTRCRERDEEDAWVPGEADECETSPAAPFDALDAVCCYGVDEWPLDRLVRAYKDGGERRAGELLARMVAQAVCDAGLAGAPRPGCAAGFLEPPDAVVFVPCTPRAFARRGFDHMERVARGVAGELVLPLLDVLARGDARDQRGLSRVQRTENVRSSLVALGPVEGMRLLLLDDVVTTGATLGAAAQVLRAAGAVQVAAAAAARVW